MPFAAVLFALAVAPLGLSGQDEKVNSAEAMLGRIDAYKPPAYTEDKSDGEFRYKWLIGFLRYLEKRNEYIWEFVKNYPDHERARPLMDEWYQNLGGGTVPCTDARVPKAVLAIDSLLVNRPPEWVVTMGHYWRAYYRMNVVWNRLIFLDSVKAPSDDRERRDMILTGMRLAEEFTEQYPQDVRGAKLYDILAEAGKDPVSSRALYGRLLTSYPDHPSIGFYKGKAHRFEQIGQPFSFALKNAKDDKDLSEKDYVGKVLLLFFWNSRLEPCKTQAREVKKIWFRHEHEGLAVMSVGMDDEDDKQKFLDFVHDYKLDFNHVFEGGGWSSPFALSWGVNAFPTWFLIDRKGVLRYVDADRDTETKVKELLAEKAG